MPEPTSVITVPAGVLIAVMGICADHDPVQPVKSGIDPEVTGDERVVIDWLHGPCC